MNRTLHRLLIGVAVALPIALWQFSLHPPFSFADAQAKTGGEASPDSQPQSGAAPDLPATAETAEDEPGGKDDSGTKGNSKKGRYTDLQFYAYASGLTGIFDRNSGRLYIYDTDLTKCIAIRQLNRLGDPMRKLK